MKSLITLLFLLLSISISAQNDWQEHFSHDRYANGHVGHFIINDDVTLLMANARVPMNTLETIKGNTKKESEVISEYFTFYSKRSRTGIDSKEILLMRAFDYDIEGYGAHSIYEKDNEFYNRSIGMVNGEYTYIVDARISGEPDDPKEYITYTDRIYLDAQDQIINSAEYEGIFAYHEGLNGKHYEVHNGIFKSKDGTPEGQIDLGTYNFLDNDPYLNQLIKGENGILYLYSYEDFSAVGTVTLPSPMINYKIAEEGYYTLSENDDTYLIYFTSKTNSNTEEYYALPKEDEIKNFDIVDFEIVGNDIYFFGVLKSSFNQLTHSYVQKRTIDKPFTPVRKDLELTFASVEGENSWSEDWYEYTFRCTVTNVGNQPVNHFTIYTSTFPISIFNYIYGKKDVNVELLPGESIEVEGEYNFYELSSLELHIVGVDYGLDSDESNNSFLADVKTSVQDVELEKLFTISPNPTSNFINLEGAVSDITSLSIIGIQGNQFKLNSNNTQKVDISFLPPGNYALLITTKDKIEKHHFIKI